MSCISAIRQHINGLDDNAMFATRDLVKYGLRNTVDQAIFKLIKCGFIIRLARGLFTKAGARTPTILEIARYKARSFGRELVTHGQQLALELLAPKHVRSLATPKTDLVFQIRGRSSAFWLGNSRIYLHGSCDRKMRGSESKTGQLIRALWYVGRHREESDLIRSIASISQHDLRALIEQSQWIPSWLSDKLRLACY